MARKRKKKKTGRGRGETFALLATGGLLTLCALSIMYGFLIRQSVAEHRASEIRIEILNGTGKSGLAARAASELRRKGVDVFSVENAEHFDYENTILIGRQPQADLQSLSELTGCKNVVEQLVADSYVHATLIIGSDYSELDLRLDGGSGLLER